jgi:hypothetical protein
MPLHSQAENPPSLEDLQKAILDGLGGRLIGEGILEDDEDDVLVPEIESLIDRFSAETLALVFLRYE